MKNLPGRKAISDPDERLAGEVLEVTRKLTMIVGLLVRGVPPIIWFTLRLWRQKGLAFATLPHIYLLAAYEITSRSARPPVRAPPSAPRPAALCIDLCSRCRRRATPPRRRRAVLTARLARCPAGCSRRM